MNARSIEGAVALVTGANRGIGRALTEALLSRGVGKVYATARNPEALRDLRDERLVLLGAHRIRTARSSAALDPAPGVQRVFKNPRVASIGAMAESGDIGPGPAR